MESGCLEFQLPIDPSGKYEKMCNSAMDFRFPPSEPLIPPIASPFWQLLAKRFAISCHSWIRHAHASFVLYLASTADAGVGGAVRL
jgi:hypothetical protein